MSQFKYKDSTIGGGGGHKIVNSSGTEMTQRDKMKFVGATVTDDSTNSQTVVTVDNPVLPTKLSDLTNDVGFIDNTVNNLTNYYAKTDTYNQTEVDNLISAAKTGRFIAVSTLPTTNIDTKAIYLVPKASTQSSNLKDEYINLDGTSSGWEKIGDTEIDLSNYVTTSALNTTLSDYATDSDLSSLETTLKAYVDSEIGSVLTEEF